MGDVSTNKKKEGSLCHKSKLTIVAGVVLLLVIITVTIAVPAMLVVVLQDDGTSGMQYTFSTVRCTMSPKLCTGQNVKFTLCYTMV